MLSAAAQSASRAAGIARPALAALSRHPAIQQTTYVALRAAVSAIGTAPPAEAMRSAASLGRVFAKAPFNKKRLRRAMENLEAARPAWSRQQRREYAYRAYEHLFMLGIEMAMAERVLSRDGWSTRVEVEHLGESLTRLLRNGPVIMITGHCGNWEFLAYAMAQLGFPLCPLYRPLDLKPIDNWVRRTRESHGLHLIDKFGAAEELPGIMARGGMPGFVADQNAGDRGIFVPFFGRLASTYKSIGLLAMQTNATIVCGMARRVGSCVGLPWGLDLAGSPIEMAPDLRFVPGGEPTPRYRLEVLDTIAPEHWEAFAKDGGDPLFYISARYRRAIEAMVARAPEQFLWMHRYWKSRPPHERKGRELPPLLRAKLQTLPWMTTEELARITENSRRDAAEAVKAAARA